MPTRSKETIFRAALYQTGHDPDPNGNLWQALESNYDDIVKAALEDADGSLPFGKTRVTLTSRANGNGEYDDLYTMPAEVLHVVEVYFDDSSASDLEEPWEVDGDNNAIMLNAEERVIKVEYVRQGDESRWSANFARGVQFDLEAVIKSVKEEENEADAKRQKADFHYLKAGVKGSKNRSQRRAWKRGGGQLMRARASAYDRSGRR